MTKNSKEYANWYYHNKYKNEKTLKDKVKRVLARRLMEKKWLVKKGDWKEVDHISWVRKWNALSNLRVITRKKNRQLWQKKWVKKRLLKSNK